LDTYLPAESVQVQFTYEDSYGEWGLAFAVDNVLLEVDITVFYVWDFEDGLQGWTHTNGFPFPGGWDVEPSGLHPGYTPPIAGDSCMAIDSDDAGSGFGLIADTAKSPAVTPPMGMSNYKWGYCNYGGSGSYINDLYVGINHYTSGSWTSVELAHYPNGSISGPAWDSADVSAYAGEDSVQAFFYFTDQATWGYWACFDNVKLRAPIDHDVGCTQVVSPPEGSAVHGLYDVIGRIQNFGNNTEAFDVTAVVYDTVSMIQVFSQNATIANFTVGGDSNVHFGAVTFDSNSYYYTEIYTMLPGDEDPSNDTSAIYSHTGLTWYDIVFDMDAQAICNDNQLIGVWFHDEYFVITGGGNAADPNKVYVVDTTGNLLWSLDQPAHSTGWGWRNIFCDYTYTGPNVLGYLYAPSGNVLDRFTIDLQNGLLMYHASVPALVASNYGTYMPESTWIFSPYQNSIVKWTWNQIVHTASHPGYSICGGAYDGDTVDGPWIWWHSQDDPGTGHMCQISQMDPYSMTFTNLVFGYSLEPYLTDGIAGGLCFYSGFRGMDVLFALVQGTPNDWIKGIFVRPYQGTSVSDEPNPRPHTVAGFGPSMPTVTTGYVPILYVLDKSTHASLEIYDGAGRFVRTLVDGHQTKGAKTINWDGKDSRQSNVASGVYILKLEVDGEADIRKVVFIR
jgi:hypothetical protein